MKTKTKRILRTTTIISIYGVCIYLSTLAPNLWAALFAGTFFAALLIGTIYRNYRYHKADKKEKQRMVKQIPTGTHYYNKWYRAADSTELEYQRQKAEEETNKIRKKS